MPSSSARAWAIGTPFARRPSAVKLRMPRVVSRAAGGSFDSGIQTSLLKGKRMSGGMTPMMTHGRLLILMTRPRMLGSLPYRFFHTPLPTITTGSPSGRSSSGRKSRPSTGRCPISWKRFADPYVPENCSGASVSSLTFMGAPRKIDRPAKLRAFSFQS